MHTGKVSYVKLREGANIVAKFSVPRLMLENLLKCLSQNVERVEPLLNGGFLIDKYTTCKIQMRNGSSDHQEAFVSPV